MCAARLRGLALASAVALAFLFPCGAIAEPLQVVVASAAAAIDARTGKPILTVRLTDEGRKSFGAFSQAHLGQAIDTRIEGKSLMKPVIREPIVGGVLQITMDSIEETRRLADRLSNGTTTLELEAIPN
jgi:preprotein translocase subunit SecD